jgi:hypothetical protein
MPDDLTAIEKRPGSFRLNLADFGVVYKATFAKGIVSDFQKTQDDPLTVVSMVKVKGDAWGESDFIPLFYCPKKDFWDTLDHQAQDLNQDKLYYENAWMSFRAGDEVKVMLKEGAPFAVLGFLKDGPRIGEDIFKFNYEIAGSGTDATGHGEDLNLGPHSIHLQCSKKTEYLTLDADSKGPDDKDLGLSEKSYQLCVSAEGTIGIEPQAGPPAIGSQPDVAWTGGIGGGESFLYGEGGWYAQYIEWLITVGPVAYIIQMVGIRGYDWTIFSDPPLTDPLTVTRTNNQTYYYIKAMRILAAINTGPDLITSIKAQGVINNGIDVIGADSPYSGHGPYYTGPDGYPDYDGFVWQHEFSDNFFTLPDLNSYPGIGGTVPHGIDYRTLSFYQKPHNPPAT